MYNSDQTKTFPGEPVAAMYSLKSNAFRKLFVIIIFVTFVSFTFFSSRSVDDDNARQIQTEENQIYAADISEKTIRPVADKIKGNMKYILLWTPEKCTTCAPFNAFGKGAFAFKRINCKCQNCYITNNKTLLGDYTKFDAILFNGRPILSMSPSELPTRRSSQQLFVFLQLESADRFPVCEPKFDGFFNRTFTYRLSSDFKWPYFVVTLLNGTVIGPKEKMDWIKLEDMTPVPKEFKEKLKTKKKIGAWFVSNCHSRNKREQFVEDLQNELKR